MRTSMLQRELYFSVMIEKITQQMAKQFTRNYICSKFEQLSLYKQKIRTLDADLNLFGKIKSLSLSANELQLLEHVPVNVEIFNACSNRYLA